MCYFICTACTCLCSQTNDDDEDGERQGGSDVQGKTVSQTKFCCSRACIKISKEIKIIGED